MGKKFEITSVKHKKLPDIEESYKLLEIIHKKMKSNLPSVSHEVDKPIILYGAGNLGKMAKEYFDKLNIKPLFIIDRNFESCNKDTFWKNNNILEPCKIPYVARKLNTVVVCIVTSPFCEIKNWLNTLGFDDIVPFYDITSHYQDKHPLNNGWYACLLDKKEIENIKFVISNLNDEVSRSYYLQFIAWHAIREEWVFKGTLISNDNRYFIPEITSALTTNETFVDIGAYHGEVTKKFIDIVKNKFNSIYAIEPDIENFKSLYENLKDFMDERVYLSMKAIGKKEETKNFYSGLGYSSQLSSLSNNEIEVNVVDNLNIKPTFIKIHTEGNEDDVIKGGIKTIMYHRPIITLTVYHNRNGLWKIQTQLMTLLENYVYYFRLHSWCGTGAVLYAVPKERYL